MAGEGLLGTVLQHVNPEGTRPFAALPAGWAEDTNVLLPKAQVSPVHVTHEVRPMGETLRAVVTGVGLFLCVCHHVVQEGGIVGEFGVTESTEECFFASMTPHVGPEPTSVATALVAYLTEQ